MPNGLRFSDEDFYAATTTVQQYLTGLEAYLERLLAFKAIDEDEARKWFLHALTTLQYKDYSTYVSIVEKDTRIINPEEGALILQPDEKPEPFTQWFPWQKPPEYTMAMPEGFSAKQLPYFKQVVAPTVYRTAAQSQAVQFGYVDPEGNIINETAYNTLLRTAIKDSESYQYDTIKEYLQYHLDVAEAEATYAKEKGEMATEAEEAEALAHYQDLAQIQQRAKKYLEDLISYREEKEARDIAVAEQEELIRQRAVVAGREREKATALERKEYWMEEAALKERPGEFEPAISAVPGAAGVVQEFLKEGRPTGLQEFIKGEMPGVLAQFEREQADARRAWWSALQQPAKAGYEERLVGAESELKRWSDVLTKGYEKGWKPESMAGFGQFEMMPAQYYFSVAQKRAGAAIRDIRSLTGKIEAGERPRQPERAGEDPLAAYLREYPWSAEFMKLSPSQRGFYPSRYAPSARWFT